MTATAERREEMLGLLAEKTLALACAVQQRALEAEDAGEMARLAAAFAKLGRCTRQSIALPARLEHERLSAPKPAPEPKPLDPVKQALLVKRRRIERAVERVLWDEYDRSDEEEEETAFSLIDDLIDHLDERQADPGFLEADLDALIADSCRALRLEPPPPAFLPAQAATPAAPAIANSS